MQQNPFNSKNPFNIPPEDYFEDFQKRLMVKINSPQNKETPTIVKLKNKRNYYYYGVAASLTLLLALGLIFGINHQSSLSNEDLQEYIQYDTSLSLSTEFINSFDQEDLIELEKSIQINQNELNNYVLTNIELEYYLND
ncbi:hypothetical protein ACYSNV_04145 [Myroides sp. LJL119]